LGAVNAVKTLTLGLSIGGLATGATWVARAVRNDWFDDPFGPYIGALYVLIAMLQLVPTGGFLWLTRSLPPPGRNKRALWTTWAIVSGACVLVGVAPQAVLWLFAG
jgi:hypothetical protein